MQQTSGTSRPDCVPPAVSGSWLASSSRRKRRGECCRFFAPHLCAAHPPAARPGRPVWAGTQGAERTLTRVQDHHLRDRGRSAVKKKVSGTPADLSGSASQYIRMSRTVERQMRRNGTPGWNRTSDRRLRRPLLYPLSYGGSQPQLSKRQVFQESESGCALNSCAGHLGSGSGIISSACRSAPAACGRASPGQGAGPFCTFSRAWSL